LPSRSPRASPETCQSRSGMRRPAGWLVTTPPGGVRQHRPSATTSGTCERTNARLTGTAHVQRPTVSPRRAWAPINRRGGAPRGERPRRADCVSGLRGTQGAALKRLRAYVIGPPKGAGQACRCTRAPVGAPPPRICEVANGKARRNSCLARTMMFAQMQAQTALLRVGGPVESCADCILSYAFIGPCSRKPAGAHRHQRSESETT
jgi:hypothetical protein